MGGYSCAAGDHWSQSPRTRGSAFFQAEFSQQFRLAGKANEIEMEGFQLAYRWTPTGHHRQQQCRDHGTVELDGYASRRFGHPMAAAQNHFQPLEKEFDLPAIAID